MTRRFVAVPVATAVRDALDAALAPARDAWEGLRTTRASDWHLTLAFLGEVADEQLERLVEVVATAVAAHPLPDELALSGAGRFGRRVLWAGVDEVPPGRLAALGDAVQRGCAAAELPVQQRAVHPHLTLARARRGAPVRAEHLDQAERAVAALLERGEGRWHAEHVEVWASHLGGGPARYEVEAAVPG